MNIETFIINVESCYSRRESILARIKKNNLLSPNIVKAIEGNDLSEKQLGCYLPPRNFRHHIIRDTMSKNEIACVLSHLKCLNEIINKCLPYGLIIEDDAIFSENFQDSLFHAINFIKKCNDPIVVLFSARTIIAKQASFSIDAFSIHKTIDGIGAYGYLVNKYAAQIIVNKTVPFSYPFDHWFFHVMHGIKLFSMQPHQLSYYGDDDDSTLRQGRNLMWDAHKKFISKYPKWIIWFFTKFTYRSIFIKIWKILNRGRYVKKEW